MNKVFLKSFLAYLSLIFGAFTVLSSILLENIIHFFPLLNFILFIIVFIAWILIDFRSQKITNKNYSLLCIIFVLFILVIINICVSKLDFNYDFTEQKVYSLSDETISILGKLSKKLSIFAIDDKQISNRKEINRLLKLYQDRSEHIEFQFLNSSTAKSVRDYINPNQSSLLYLEYGEGQNKIAGKLNKLSESQLTQAIYRMLNNKSKIAYYIVGHGEPDPESFSDAGLSNFTELLKGQNINLAGLVLTAEVPENAEFIILVAPTKPYLRREIEIIKNYLRRGGKALILADPEQQEDFNQFTKNYGITINKDVILDQQNTLQGGIAWQIILKDYRSHPVTAGLSGGQTPSVFLMSSSLKTDARAREIIFTSQSAWAETNLSALFQETPIAAYEAEEDQAGPVAVAAAYEKQLESKKMKLMVFSDIEWLRNVNLELYSNKDLALNVVNWLASEDEALIIPKRILRPSRLSPISQSTFQRVIVLAFLLPEILLIIVLGLWLYRKNRR